MKKKNSKCLKLVSRIAICSFFLQFAILGAKAASSTVVESKAKILAAQQEQIQLKGKVTDSQTGDPLPGVNIVVQGTTIGVTSDKDGNYMIELPSADATLVFSFIGYVTETVKYAGQTSLDISLVPDITKLDEVVVVGYGTVKKRDLTGSVASVSGNKIAMVPVPNIAQALQGKLSGVNVISQDGRPDATVNIRIRGGTSISQSNQPLILIDGVPGSLSDIPAEQVSSVTVLKDASSTAIYGARGANGVILVTTKRAKAGKMRVSYDGYVKFNTPTKYMDALGPYDYLSFVWAGAAAAGDAYRIPFEKLYGIGAYPGSNTGGIESYRNMATDDIQRQIYNSSVSKSHNFTISGGNETTKMLLSINNIDDEGMKIQSYSKRTSVDLKVDQKIFKNVNLRTDTRFTNIQDLGDESTVNGNGSYLSYAYRFRPIATNHILGDLGALNEGNVEQYGQIYLWDTYSPLAMIKDFSPLTKTQKFINLTSLNWEIFKGLRYNSDFSIGKQWGNKKYWKGAIYNHYLDDATGEKLYAGDADYQKIDSWTLRWTNTLTYDLNLGSSQKLNLLVGQEFSNSGGTNLRTIATYFPANYTEDKAFAQINQFDQTKGSINTTTGVDMPERIESFFGRANYNLLDKYLFTFTFRADGSSRFAPSHKWGYFPAGAFAWRMSEEPFMKDINWLDNLKLRFSYGQVGNDDLGSSNRWQQLWASENTLKNQYVMNGAYQSGYTYASLALANPNLKWETTITRNLGVDYALFSSRLSGSIDVYKNTTRDLLMLRAIAGVSGSPSMYDNVGQTSNKGLEIALSGVIFKNNNWEISASGNINFNRNNIDKLAEGVSGLYGTTWAGTGAYPGNDFMLEEGQPVGIVRGLTYDGFYTPEDFTYANGVYTLKPGIPDAGKFSSPIRGVDNMNARPVGQIAYPGVPKFKDISGPNGVPDGVIDDYDLGKIGNMNPKNTGGFNLNVSYKNFDFGASFNWSYGNQIYNITKMASLRGYKEFGVYENKLSFIKNSYKIYDLVNGQLVSLTTPDQLNAANANATLPLPYIEPGLGSTLGIEDGSYLRLNTLTLGYTLPKTILENLKMSNLRIYGSVYNVFTITGYSGLDPEVSTNMNQNKAQYPTPGIDWGAYPRPRSFIVGLNIGF